jgi:Xaa-Pro dipeptidase
MMQGDLSALYAEHVAWLQSRYDEALARAGYDAVVIHSGTARKRSDFDDQYWPLRSVPHFQHWAALKEPDALLVVRPTYRPALLRVTCFDFWEHRFEPESDHFFDALDVHTLERIDDAQSLLPGGRVAFVGDDRERATRLGFDDGAVNPEVLLRALDALRTRKTRYEVACIAEANLRAARGHDAVLAAFRGGADVELALHLAYLSATEQDDPETPYKNIVALGRNAATLHHVSYGRRHHAPRAGEPVSLLLDAGATCFGYCSDITRTWVRGSGATADAFGALIAGVEALQQRLCSAVQVGNGYEALHDEAHREVGALLRDVGIVRASVDEAVDKDVTRAFFPHGLGHSLGLQCHDVGCAVVKPRDDNPFLRNTSTIAQGQVFTIEPGVYFIDGLLTPLRASPHASTVQWNLVDALTPFGGVRIEDDLVIVGTTRGDARNLTREHLSRGGGPV